jgi:DNA-binding transcriptional MerR regulator
VAPKLYKASDVCELAQVQLYVLRSWEKDFPGIGIQKSAEGPRLYRQSDLDQVIRIKQLVFGEGLTVSGARRRIEESAPAPSSSETRAEEVEEALDVLGAHARSKIANVREGLRAIHSLLSNGPGEFELQPPPVRTPSTKKKSAAAAPLRIASKAGAKASVASGLSRKAVAKKKPAASKRRGANA